MGEQSLGRHNTLNFLRLVFALMVVLSHSFVGGFVDPLLLNQTSVGTVGVSGFFGISGYLIAARRNKFGNSSGCGSFADLPAFWVCLVLTKFGLLSSPGRRHSPNAFFSSCLSVRRLARSST